MTRGGRPEVAADQGMRGRLTLVRTSRTDPSPAPRCIGTRRGGLPDGMTSPLVQHSVIASIAEAATQGRIWKLRKAMPAVVLLMATYVAGLAPAEAQAPWIPPESRCGSEPDGAVEFPVETWSKARRRGDGRGWWRRHRRLGE